MALSSKFILVSFCFYNNIFSIFIVSEYFIVDYNLLLFSLLYKNISNHTFSLFSGCNIVSVTSPSASTLNVIWSSYTGASVYLLDLRVVNSTSIAPVVVMQSAPSTQRLIQGLRPGHVYQVTLKVFEFYTVVCTDTENTMTGTDNLIKKSTAK